MSINAEFVALSADELAGLIDDPDSVDSFFMPVAGFDRIWSPQNLALVENLSPEALASAVQGLDPQLRDDLTQRIQRVQQALASGQSASILPLTRAGTGAGGSRPKLSLEKAWHGVHYLLTGEAESSTGAVLGGTEIGDDGGYGAARYFTAAEVSSLATELDNASSGDVLHARYAPGRMNDLAIYPGGWDDPESREWLIDALGDLRRFFAEAASRGDAIIICLV